jgi:hypothetical protein
MTDLHGAANTLLEIDARIAVMESQLAALKEQRNRLAAPLCRMPHELVVRMFRHVQDPTIMSLKPGEDTYW